MSEREHLYKSVIADYFGSQLAHNILPETHVIHPLFNSHINERDLHPFVQPTYRALIKQDLTTLQWAELLHIILSCKCIRKQKVGKVFKNVYETLTSRSVEDTLFDLLPYADKQLWFHYYVESDEVIADPRKFAEHTKQCLKINLDLISTCNEYDLETPNFNETEYFEQLNLRELCKRNTPVARNNLPLSEEIKQTLEELEQSYPFEDFKTIDECKSISKITVSPERIVVDSPTRANNNISKSTSSQRAPPDSSNSTSSNSFESSGPDCSKSDNPDTSDRQIPSKIPNYRPPPSNPNYQQVIFTSSPQLQPEPPRKSQLRHSAATMARNIRLVDFMPTKFSPDKLDCDPEAHILGFRDWLSAQLNEPNLDNIEIPEEKLDMFKFTCLAEARLWYETNKPFEGIADLESKFLQEFADGLQSTTTAAQAFSQLKYNPKTKISSFVNKMMRLNRTLQYSDNVLRDRLMSAVPSQIRQLAKLNNPQSFRDTYQAIRSVLEDQNTEKNTVAMINNDEVTDSLNDLSLHISNMRKDINNMSNSFKGNQFQSQNNNFRPQTNRPFQSFQNSRGFRRPGQFNNRQGQFNNRPGQFYNRPPPPPRQMGGRDQPNFGRGQFNNYRGRDRTGPNFNKSTVRCYSCNKLGHLKFECRNRRFTPENQRRDRDYRAGQGQSQ